LIRRDLRLDVDAVRGQDDAVFVEELAPLAFGIGKLAAFRVALPEGQRPMNERVGLARARHARVRVRQMPLGGLEERQRCLRPRHGPAQRVEEDGLDQVGREGLLLVGGGDERGVPELAEPRDGGDLARTSSRPGTTAGRASALPAVAQLRDQLTRQHVTRARDLMTNPRHQTPMVVPPQRGFTNYPQPVLLPQLEQV
jgi:hypothetical protein